MMPDGGGGGGRTKSVSVNTAKLSNKEQEDYARWNSYGRGCPQGAQVISFNITDKTHRRSRTEVFFEQLPTFIISSIMDSISSISVLLSGANSVASYAYDAGQDFVNVGEYEAIHVEMEYYLQNPLTNDWVYNKDEYDYIIVYPQTGSGDVKLYDYHWPD